MPAANRVTLGLTGLSVSPVGFGGYRIDESERTHQEALELALASGCNLVDTSTNYTDGSSERLIGKSLRKLEIQGAVVVTKIGYVQGSNLELARAREAEGKPFPGMVKYSESCWHCLSPEFLEDQLTRSLERLGRKSVDIVLLHNPEYFLKTSQDHGEYYRRIGEAFAHFEKEADRGRIRFYGVSSNTLPDPKESDEFTSLETLLSIAGPRFGVIQFPFNFLEPGAALEPNNSGKTVLELARSRNLGTLVNRPLNAFAGRHLVRLASFRAHVGVDHEAAISSALNDAMRLEAEYSSMKLEATYPKGLPVPLKRLAWGHIVKQNFAQIDDLLMWRDVLSHQIGPAIEETGPALDRDPSTRAWATEHKRSLATLFRSVTDFFESKMAESSEAIEDALVKRCPALKATPTLSRKAIRVYRSLPGLHCVLVGMRSPAYVKDALAMDPALSPEEAMAALEVIRDLEKKD